MANQFPLQSSASAEVEELHGLLGTPPWGLSEAVWKIMGFLQIFKLSPRKQKSNGDFLPLLVEECLGNDAEGSRNCALLFWNYVPSPMGVGMYI